MFHNYLVNIFITHLRLAAANLILCHEFAKIKGGIFSHFLLHVFPCYSLDKSSGKSAWLQYLLQRKSSILQDLIKFIINGCRLTVRLSKKSTNEKLKST